MFTMLLSALVCGSTAAAADGDLLAAAAGLGAVSYGNTVLWGSFVALANEGDRARARRTGRPDPIHGAGDHAPLYIPVVGPFLAVKTLDATGGVRRLLIADGVLQTAAMGLCVAGIVGNRGGRRRVGLGMVGVRQVRVSVAF